MCQWKFLSAISTERARQKPFTGTNDWQSSDVRTDNVLLTLAQTSRYFNVARYVRRSVLSVGFFSPP